MKESPPIKDKTTEIESLYLKLNLQDIAKRLGRPLVIANYVCDLNDVIAKKGEGGEFQVATELKNSSDWRLFQELTAQSDAIITGAGYLNRYKNLGEKAEDIIDQFSPRGQFAALGVWRQENGLKRNPDLIVVSRSLDFDIPKAALEGERKVYVFTTYTSSMSSKAKEYEKIGASVIGAGEEGVDGKLMLNYLKNYEKYNVIKMTTGPRVLKILLDANILDALFITRVSRKIEADPADIQSIIKDGKVDSLPGFHYKKMYNQSGVKAADGETISQEFGIYEKGDLI